MKVQDKICPACSNQIDDESLEFCKICNWEVVIISGSASQALLKYYNDKLERHKVSITKISKLKHENVNMVQQFDLLENRKSELESKNRYLNSEIENLNDKIKKYYGLVKEIEILQTAINALQEENKELKIKVTNQNDPKI